MRPTLGLTGMDPVTESALQAAFADANARVGGHWQLLSDADADYVVVDMDSMYGPMSWLRLHGAGKTVIGLTSASRVQTEYRLGKPFGAGELKALLQQLDSGAPEPRTSAPLAAPANTPEPETPPPTPIEAPAAVTSEPVPMAVAPAAVAAPEPDTVPSEAAQAPQPAPPAPAAPVERRLGDWLAPGALKGKRRFQRDSLVLLIDAERRQYHGPALLKPLDAAFQGPLDEADFVALDAAEWDRQAATLGVPQPLGRLVWFGALLADRGRLAAGYDPGARYQLLKWPQTEREFPKHFRIATAMMKGPATLPEIADASGVTPEEATDFVNANLATGFAEPFREPEPEADPPKSGGLFGRLRGR